MTVPAAVVGNDGVCAVFTARDMAAERYRTAALDGRHHLQLVEADVPGIGAPPCRPVAAEDIRDLQRRTGHRRRPLCQIALFYAVATGICGVVGPALFRAMID